MINQFKHALHQLQILAHWHSSQDQQNTEIKSIIELNSFAICIRDQL